MPKRKNKSFQVSPKDAAAYFGNESEQEDILSKKRSSTSRLCSTPQDSVLIVSPNYQSEGTSDEDDSQVTYSHATSNGSKYNSFASILKLNSFESDSDEQNLESGISNPEDEDVLLDHETYFANDLKDYRKCYGKQEKAYQSCKPLLEMAEKGIRIIFVPSKNIEVISLPHRNSLTLLGYLEVSVLLGRISILGHEIPEGKSARVFSTEGSTLLQAVTVKSAHKSTVLKVSKKLSMVLSSEEDDKLDDFLENIGPSTVVLVLKKRVLPPSLRFLELYFPTAVQVLQKKSHKPRYMNDRLCSLEEKGTFIITEESEWLADEINRTITKSIKSDDDCRIAMHGPSGSGKSFLLRYLINSALNEFPCVYYLDIDPGQTEFTPPGVVSLFRVTEPLLGPPFCHQRKPLKMIFTGSISISSPSMYVKSALGLIEIFKNKFGESPLFVNTMGWIDGIGEMCIKNIWKGLDPTIIIDFMSPDVLPDMEKVQLSDKTVSFKIPARKPLKLPIFTSRDLRDFALLSYLGKVQKYFTEPTYLHAFRPVMVCWDNVAIHVMDKKVPPNRLIEAIQCSIVALCRVNKDLVLECDKSEYPRTLVDEPLNDCLGFGVVRASDETHHLLYIVTPLSLEELKLVNAIIKGNILLPDEVYLKQSMLNVPLPYTDCSKGVLSRRVIHKISRKSKIGTPGVKSVKI